MKLQRFLSVFLLVTILFTCGAVPARADGAETLEDPDIQAKAALLVDAATGNILYEKNKDTQLYPASLTKIMTCLLVMEAIDDGVLSLDQEITAPAEAFLELDADGSTAGIKEGEILSVRNLLYCMMVVSANEVCNIFAVTLDGSIDAFVERMNLKAQSLGCVNTHFANAIGLPDTRHYTSAWDIYLITKEALTHDIFMTICDTAEVTIPETNLSSQRVLRTTNYLLSAYRATGYLDSRAHGIKTGSTTDAGHCLVSTASQNGLDVISVVLGAEVVTVNGKNQVQSFSETSRLFDWVFKNFSYQTVLTPEDMLQSVPVALSKTESIVVHSEETITALLPTGVSASDLDRTFDLQENVQAPVEKGQILGTVTLSYNGTVYATAELAALDNVEVSVWLTILDRVQQFLQLTAVRIAGGVVLAAVAVVALWKVTVGRRRYRYGRKVRNRGSNGGYRGRRKR